MLMYNTFLHEPQLLAFDLEQALNVRQQPQFLGAIVPVPTQDCATRRISRRLGAPAARPHLLKVEVVRA
jgi:hypothetical protein